MVDKHILTAVAWPYANGPRHIGHIAGFGIPSDAYARYQRMAGNRVLMISGSDEHGTPIQIQADSEGITPGQLADRYNRVIVQDLHDLGMSYDLFTRTTTTNHYSVVQTIFKALLTNGYIQSRPQKSAVSPSTGRTLPDRYIEGICPHCSYDGARGDQCDSCGNQLDPQDLIKPRSRINGEVPSFVESEQFFLDLPAFAENLARWLGTRHHWRSNVISFSRNLVDDLRPRAITRDLDWGVPIPAAGWSPDEKRIYVWFDAVIGYLSASIEWARRQGDPEAWRAWWSEGATAKYFMGKDNVVFHSVIWPAILLGASGLPAGEAGPYGALHLPDDIVASEFLTMEGRKFSSSRAIVIYVRDVLDRYGQDPLRYYLAAAGPETADADFSWEHFVTRNNNELVAAWGNLVNRTITLAAKTTGSVPERGPVETSDAALLDELAAGFAIVGSAMDQTSLRAATAESMRLVRLANAYLSEQQPWKLTETDPRRFATVMNCALQAVSDCNTMLTPIIPDAAQRVHEMLGRTGVWSSHARIVQVEDLDDGHRYPILTNADHGSAVWARTTVTAGTPLRMPPPLFRKLDSTVVLDELARLEAQ